VLVSFPQPNRELADYLMAVDDMAPIHLVGDVTGTNGVLPAIHQAAAITRAL
jgi:hypothetical protein